MSFAGPGDAAWLIPVLMFFTGCSFGFAMAPSQAAAMATVSAAQTGHASTLLNTLRQAGGAAGVALLGTVLAATRPGPLTWPATARAGRRRLPDGSRRGLLLAGQRRRRRPHDG